MPRSLASASAPPTSTVGGASAGCATSPRASIRRVASSAAASAHAAPACAKRTEWDDYLRQQAAAYRQLAEKAEDAVVKKELLDLANVCEEVANNIEDRLTSG
jgi:hypothetical protein